MFVATGSFSPKNRHHVKFCVDFNHFKNINISALLQSKTLKARFWTTLGCSFICYQRKFNLLKSSLWICHLKMIKMYRTLDRKSAFTSAAIWWSSTLESGELVLHHCLCILSIHCCDDMIPCDDTLCEYLLQICWRYRRQWASTVVHMPYVVLPTATSGWSMPRTTAGYAPLKHTQSTIKDR